MRPLRIVQISTFDHAGGAEKSARKLHEAFQERGHSSLLLVGEKRSDDPDVIEIDNSARGHGIRGRFKTGLEARFGLQYLDYPGSHRIPELVGRPWDITHVHNLHGGYFDLAALPRLTRYASTILSLKDMWLLTGHCAHSFSCERWRQACGSCPDLEIYPAISADATRYNLRRKARLLGDLPLVISSPGRWLLDCVGHSYLANKPRRWIPNFVDTRIFKPGDRSEARRELQLPLDRPILFMAAHAGFLNPWKDASMFEKAIQSMPHPRALGVAFGPEDERRGDDVWVRSGTFDESRVARYYQAADVIACPAHAETFGLTVIEGFATARPVVATRVGGMPEIVSDGSTGILVDPGDTKGFASAIEALFSRSDLAARLGQAGLEEARGRYELGRVVDTWLDWYSELVEASDKAEGAAA